MNRGTSRRVRATLLAAGVVVAGLAGAPGAQAADVDGFTEPGGTVVIEVYGVAAGEQNDITVAPSGAIVGNDVGIDPTMPLLPTTVVVTDSTTPLGDIAAPCERIDAHSARCTAWPGRGFGEVDANLAGGPGDSFKLDPGATGATTPMKYTISTRDGDDVISLPVSRGLSIYTADGNDAVTANGVTGWFQNISTAGGDDRVRINSTYIVDVHCGDGNDDAVVVATQWGERTDCESGTTVTPPWVEGP